MRKTLFSLFALGAILICLPASAQTVSSLNLSNNAIVGGQPTTVTATLASPAPAGGTRVIFYSLSPRLSFPVTPVDVAANGTTATFTFTPLPVDTTGAATVAAVVAGSPTVQTATLTLFASRQFRWRIAVYRPGTAEWYLRNDDGTATRVQFGQAGDIPRPDDYLEGPNGPGPNGAARHQIAVYRPSTGQWFIRSNTNGQAVGPISFGQANLDIPAPSDYLGQGKSQIAVFRPTSQQMFILSNATGTGATSIVNLGFGQAGDVPQFIDFQGSGRGQVILYRPSNQNWLVRQDDGTNITAGPFGGSFAPSAGDIPVAGPYLGSSKGQLAVYRPSTGTWFIRQDTATPTGTPASAPATIQWGLSGVDIPVPGDYFGSGHFQVAVYRPTTGQWIIRTDTGDPVTVSFGGTTTGDLPVAAAYAPNFGP
jgi:hypothetical protein